jgi:RHS repeat-associated protein
VEPVGRGSARRAKTPADPRAEPPGGVDELPAPDPGQWFQSESGLHQNWMRDYDPTTGRYLQADPLGLVDGASVYGYVRQSPMMLIDPTGEAIPLLARAAAPLLLCLREPLCQKWLTQYLLDIALAALGADSLADLYEKLCNPPPPLPLPPNVTQSKGFPPGYMPGPAGAELWGKNNGIDPKKAREKFHRLKGKHHGSGATENYGVNPESGDIVDGNGESAGNMDD